MDRSNLMEFGRYRGQPMGCVPTVYLMWSITMLGIRRNHHAYVLMVLLELQCRLDRNIKEIHSELVMTPLPKRQPRRLSQLFAKDKQFETIR